MFFNLEIKNVEGIWMPFESRYGICMSVNKPYKPDTLKKMVPGYFWTFTLPAYEGTRKALFTYKLTWSLSHIYSNEFEGTYNPSQLLSGGIRFSGNEIEKYFGTMRSHEYIPKKCRSFMICGSDLGWGKCYEDE